jgi:polysaccharide biosynthesis/export protein
MRQFGAATALDGMEHMRSTLIAFLAAGLALAAPGSARAETFEPLRKESRQTPADLLRGFEAPEETEYVIGEGDEIALNVWGRPELSGKHVIGPDGKATLPYVGAMRLAGLTRTGVVSAALAAWGPLYEDLNVTVDVLKYESNRIFVLGRVANPGVLRFENQPTLLEAITRAGGLPIGGIGAEKAALARCMVFRGQDKLVWIELRSLLNGSNLALNIRLQRNDTIYIPDSDDQLVYVMGEVLRPGAIRVTPDMTFMNALAQAGGPTDDARAGRVRLIRPSAGIEREFDLSDFYRAGREENVALQDGDVIYVSRSRMAKVGYVLQKLSPLTGWMLFGAAFGK